MHIHPNSNLTLASLGVGREQTLEILAKRAAEVRRKLSSTSHLLGSSEEASSYALRIDHRTDQEDPQQSEETSFGKLFSAKV